MSPREQETSRAGLELERRAGAKAQAAFYSLGIFDLVCLGLGLGTAFKTSSTRVVTDEEETTEEVAAAPAMLRVAEAEAASVAPPVPLQAAPVAAPAQAAAPQPPSRPGTAPASPSPAPAGLGIFSMLGKEPAATPRSILAPDVAPAPGSETHATPPDAQVGLINLDLGDERQAA
jgi:hypothetical protein